MPRELALLSAGKLHSHDFIDGEIPFNSTWLPVATLADFLPPSSDAPFPTDRISMRSWHGTHDGEFRG
jgi:hypothetical protein